MPHADLEPRSRSWLDAAAIVATLLLAITVERALPTSVPTACLYFLPIAIAGWRRQRVACIAVVLCAATLVGDAAFTSSALLACAARLAIFAIAGVLASRLHAHLEGLTFCAYHDALTGLRNRRGLELAAGVEIARARRTHRPLTLAYLDLDDFKVVNDTRGHAEGDRLLELVAAGLRTTRACDLAARVGGDEFVLLMPDTDEPSAEAAIERVRAAITAGAAERGLAIAFTCGMATFDHPPDSIADMLRAVDGMLYEGKRTRKSSVRTAHIVESLSTTTRVRRSALAAAMH